MDTTATLFERTNALKLFALSCGFSSVGITPATSMTEEYNRMKEWLQSGYHGTMEYLARNAEKREDITQLLPHAKSVIVLTHNYYTERREDGKLYNEHSDSGLISRYAWGDDYHDVIPPKLRMIEEYLRKQSPDTLSRNYVDTGPVMEKAWAARAGVGWQGKHSNIISRQAGSYFFIAVIITTAEFIYDSPIDDYCGTCTACMDACPTGAIIEPYKVDSTKCIPYWTIETKPDIEIPLSIAENLDGWLFGCDVCQDVCPWNRFRKVTNEMSFHPRNGETSLLLDNVENMTQEEFSLRFRKSPIKRTKLAGLKRNARALK